MTDSEKLDMILSEVQDLKAEVQDLKAEVQGVKAEVQGVKAEVQDLKQRMDNVEADMQGMKAEMQDLKQRMDNVETDVRATRLMLENEIRTNIMRVAEGHLDISRNLHEALKIDNEKEMLAIRVNFLEAEVRGIKTQLETA